MILFGWLSDIIGRKPVILGGLLLAAVTYYPLYAVAGIGHAAGQHQLSDRDPHHRHPGLLCGMVYGPVGAFLAEYFPARIRYTSVSVPYHIGNGWGGGLVPFITTAAVRGHRQRRLRADLPDRGAGGVLHARTHSDAGDAQDQHLEAGSG